MYKLKATWDHVKLNLRCDNCFSTTQCRLNYQDCTFQWNANFSCVNLFIHITLNYLVIAFTSLIFIIDLILTLTTPLFGLRVFTWHIASFFFTVALNQIK